MGMTYSPNMLEKISVVVVQRQVKVVGELKGLLVMNECRSSEDR